MKRIKTWIDIHLRPISPSDSLNRAMEHHGKEFVEAFNEVKGADD